MKIASSDMTMSSVSRQELVDVAHTKTSRRRILTRKGTESPGRGTGSEQQAGAGPAVMIDRVTISSSGRQAFQSNFSSSTRARSTVIIKEGTRNVSHEQTSAVEKMVGGLIDQARILELEANGNSQVESTGEAADSESWQMEITKADIHYERQSMSYDAQGSVVTEDGRSIDFSLAVSLEQSTLRETYHTDSIHVKKEAVDLTDPLVISLSGKAPELTDMTFSFDLDNDGEADNISFLKSGSGFLALDRNQDGKINNGSELFGPDMGNGFDELKAYDGDGNDWIDENDAVFEQLSVWTRDKTGKDVLISLKDAGIGAIALQAGDTAFDLKSEADHLNGRLSRNGIFLFENGRVGGVQQIDLASRKSAEVRTPDLLQQPMGPLKESLEIRSQIQENNLNKVIQARQRVFDPPDAAAIPEAPENRFKDLMKRVEKLKEQFEKTLNIHRSTTQDTLGHGSGMLTSFHPELGREKYRHL